MTARVPSVFARAALVALPSLAVSMATPARGGTVMWSTDNSGEWTNPANWDVGALPGPSDDVVLDRGPANPTITYRLTQAGTVNSLLVGERLDLRGPRILTVNQAIQLNDTLSLGESAMLRNGAVAGSPGGLVLVPNIGANTSRATINGTSFDAASVIRIDAGQAGFLNLLGAWRNAGTIELRSGTLNLGGTFRTADVAGLRRTGGSVTVTGALDNAGQVLTLDNNTGSWDLFGTTQATPARIVGGVVATKDGTSLKPWSASELDGVTLQGTIDGVTTDGIIHLRNDLVLDNGTIRIGSGDIVALGAAPQAIRGSGEIYLTRNSSELSAGQSSELTIGPGVTVHGAGRVSPNGGRLVNEGTIRADSPVDALYTGIAALGSGFDNRGLLEADGGSMILDVGDRFTNTGVLRVARGIINVRAEAPLAISNALRVDTGGTIRAASGINLVAGGTLSGTGNVDANVASAGAVAPGDLAGAGGSIGALTVSGDYAQESAGDLLIELDSGGLSPRHDRLVVTGAMALNGDLRVAPTASFLPAAGDRFDLLDFGSLTGAFTNVELPPLAAGLRWDTSQLYTTGAVSVVPEPAVGVLFLAGLGCGALRRRGRRGAGAS